jgi:DNA-binding NarL/FixJ family response regulator
MNPITVLLVDDHPVIRSGIRTLLEKETDIDVVGEAENGHQAIQMAADLMPNVIVLDMEIPGMNGIEVAKQLRKEGMPGRVLALSGHSDIYYIEQLLAAGASGYLVKEEAPMNILEAIRGVARGEQGWLSRQVSVQIASSMTASKEDRNQELTPREMQVLRGVTSGKTNKGIAEDLQISEKTVEKHMDSILAKLGVASRVEAAVYAVRRGWVSQ